MSYDIKGLQIQELPRLRNIVLSWPCEIDLEMLNLYHYNHQNTSKINARKTFIRGLFKHLILGLFPDRKFPWLEATSNHNIPINQLVQEKTS